MRRTHKACWVWIIGSCVTCLSACNPYNEEALKPLEAECADLKAQIAKLNNDQVIASQAVQAAQSTANQALAAAHASQSCCDATNEKIDRMFAKQVQH